MIWLNNFLTVVVQTLNAKNRISELHTVIEKDFGDLINELSISKTFL